MHCGGDLFCPYKHLTVGAVTIEAMSRVCVFCRRDGQRLTGEHIYPDWLSKLFNKKLKVTNEVSGDDLSRKWPKTIFQDKTNQVCGGCNNGWMCTIDNEAKELLISLAFTHHSRTLSQEDQRKISLWVQKTVLVLNKATGGKFEIPDTFYEQLYASQTIPRTNMMVGLGWRAEANGTKEQPLATFEIKQVSSVDVEKNSVDAIKQDMEDGRLIWAATLGLGYAVFQIVGTNLNGQLEVGSSDPRMFPQLNPYVEDLQWPTEWPLEAVGGLQAVRKGMYGDNVT